MGKFSLTISGLIVFVLSWFFQYTGIPVVEDEIETTVSVIMKVIAAVMIYIGRKRHGDINWYGMRTKKMYSA